jgi:hypothetical protein
MFQVLRELPSLISKAKISVNMMSSHPETRTEFSPARLSKLKYTPYAICDSFHILLTPKNHHEVRKYKHMKVWW